ncbi:ATP-binding cassette domain-containing protein, partial [Enterococcus faecalis]|uniref:ATP-binding cassette domain-containing protein n=1 Tax=Enterococcus faecalis TaxID=1351 RepID=UPI003D6B53E4
ETLHVLDDINLQVDAGEFLEIMGPSGSGKSTLINLLAFIDKKFEGTYLFEDREIGDFSDKKLSRIRNEAVGFVFQNF